MDIMKTKFSISMDSELLKIIDSSAKRERRTRSNFIEHLLLDIYCIDCPSTAEEKAAVNGQ